MAEPTDPEQLRRPPVEAVESRNGAMVVRLAGELDLYNADEVRSALREATGQVDERLVVDLAEVTFLDSTALAVLIDARRTLGGSRLLLAAPSHEVRRALEVSGLGRHFGVHDSVAEALTARL